jgi:DNA-binding transcriptional LysR family regulator
MLDGIDALVALETFGTVSEASTRLRLTQSAVTKRIQSLQVQVGFRLVEPDGRRLRLTPRAVAFLDRARPLVAELRGLVRPVTLDSPASFSLALADSIASSWGPSVLRRALGRASGVRVDLHAHRSVLVIESVRLGRYDAGLCTESTAAKDLVQHPVVDEPLVLVLSGLESKWDRGHPLITIEQTSATWRAVQPLVLSHYPDLLARELVFVESFGAALQMVKAGFGNGLLPLGFVRDMKISRRSVRPLTNVARRVALFTRKSLQQQASFVGFRDELASAAKAHFAEGSVT